MNSCINIPNATANNTIVTNAILPLSGFYKQLEAMISSHLNTGVMEKYLSIIADNSSKGIYLEDGTLVGHLLPALDEGLGNKQKLTRRLSL